MKNTLGCTFFPTHSSDTAFRYKPASEPRKMKSPLQKPNIFTQEIVFSNENDDRPNNAKYGAFSLEKLTFEKFKQQKQMLQNARLPSFHIKRLIDKSTKKRKEVKQRQNSKDDVSSSSKKQLVTQDQLKKYWQNYLNNEIMSKNSSPRTFLSPLGKGKKTRSELSKELSNRQKGENDKGDKQSFFMNNFIRTNYRRRKDNKAHFGHELSLMDRREAIRSQLDGEDSIIQMAPWEKENEEEDCFHFHGSPFNLK